MFKALFSLYKLPSPEIVRQRMLEATARDLLQAEADLHTALANRDQYARLLDHLKVVNYQGLVPD